MSVYVPEAPQFVCDFISRLPTTDTGKPFQLYPWQETAINDFYGTMVEDEAGELLRQYWFLYLEIAKKNGKSELAASLGLYHLIGDGEPNAEVYICAADKDNASIIFNDALFMVQNTPWLSKMVANGTLKIKESQRTIVFREKKKAGNGATRWVNVGTMKVLSSEAYSKHGYKPSCVIFDELHAQPNRDLWDIMTFGSGSGRRQPVYIVLTTAGDDPDRNSIGWEIHEKAVAVRDARRLRQVLDDGGDPHQILSLKHVADEDMEKAQEDLLSRDLPNWLPILYGITAMFGDDPDDLAKVDIWDENLWYLCNPSLGKHLKLRTLRLEAKDAKLSEAGEKLFRWLRLNQWISVKAVGWLPLTLYDKTQWGPSAKLEREEWIRQHLYGLICYGGVDLSSTTDLTAFILFFPPQQGLDVAVWLPFIWHAGGDIEAAEKRDHAPYRDWERAGFMTICDGDVIDYADVEQTINWAHQVFDLKAVGWDPYLSRMLTQRMQPTVQCIEIPQDFKNFTPAMKEIDVGMRKHEILHVHNTCFRWTFGNVRILTDGNMNTKIAKKRSVGRVDPPVALVIAVAVWMILRPAGPDINEHVMSDDWGL